MDDFPPRTNGNQERGGHVPDDWAELLARTVAHLAAQLTMTQVRLRALATEMTARDPQLADAVRERVQTIAAAETGRYLRENLGETLIEMIDVEALEGEIVAFLAGPDQD